MARTKQHKESELEGLHYSILEDWVDKGRTEKLPEEMLRYLEQLNFVNSLWKSLNDPQKIIRKLCISFPELTSLTAKTRFEDAMTWFYLDDQVKQDTWRNALFQKMMQLVDAAILSAKTVDDYNKASIILERAYRIKGLEKDEDPGIPEEAFKKPIKIYSLDTSEFADLPQSTNRYLLAQYVDEMNLTEDQKIKIKQDMSVEPKEIFTGYEQKKDDQ